MVRAPNDASAKYLALVREHRHRFSDALAVYFPPDTPDLALIELPGDVVVRVRRREVTDLLEFARTEEVDEEVDELELQLEFDWASSARLEDPPMVRVTNPERKMVSRWKVVV